MNADLTIIKNNHLGVEVWRYSGKVITESRLGFIAEAFFNRADFDFNGVLLKEGDRFLELYLYAKWFNIYEIHDRDTDTLKAWYCNVTRPVRVSDGRVEYDDMALDLLVFPDGRQLALDEDDFKALDLIDGDRQQARSALQELQSLFSRPDGVNIHGLL